MKLKFTKMQGAGNDFVVLDGYSQALDLSAAQVRALADRHFGVGADQLLLVEKPTVDGVDFKYRIFNCDGGEVEHCGNGARCFVKFVRDRGLTAASTVRVQVQKGVITLTMQDNGEVTVDMGAPVFDPPRVPFDASGLDGRSEGNDTLWPLDVGGKTRWVSVVSMGNPHAVQVVDDVEAYPVLAEGPQIERHPRFPERVNAGFMQIVDRHSVKLRVFEARRGRNARLRHGRMRGGGRRHPARRAGFAGARRDARRHAHDQLGRRTRRIRRAFHGRTRRDGLRRRDRAFGHRLT